MAILRGAVDAPDLIRGRLRAARAAVHAEAVAELETPARLVRHRLRALLFPTSPLPDARATATATLSAERLQAFWSHHFQPERMRAVVVGGVDAEAVKRAFRGWPAQPATAPVEPGDTTAAPVIEMQVLIDWAGVGYPAGAIDPATAAVAAALLERHLNESGLRRGQAEVWWHGDRRAVVVIAADNPGAKSAAAVSSATSAPSLAQRLRTLVAETAALLEPTQLMEARRALRRDLLFAARTPHGFAEIVGTFLDRTGEPAAATRFVDALDHVEITRVRAAMLAMLLADPAVVELHR